MDFNSLVDGMSKEYQLALVSVATTFRLASDREKARETITQEEMAILTAYRAGSSDVKKAVKKILDVF